MAPASLEGLQAWEKGGPNDPTVAFEDLRAQLKVVKDELAPWGWRAYATEFQDRQDAERRLRALAAMPGSGSEPEDGIVEGTPMWQERLDSLLLVEHLKKKIMKAQTKFAEAAELLIASHAWLVKDFKLSDVFVKFITHIPESESDRLDFVMAKYEQCNKELIRAKNEFSDWKISQRQVRHRYLDKVIENQRHQLRRQIQMDAFNTYCQVVFRAKKTFLEQVKRNNEARIMCLEAENDRMRTTFSEERCMWHEDRQGLEESRNHYKKQFQKMVAAHKAAQEEAKRLAGTAEGQAMALQVLTSEKQLLTQQVHQLTEDKASLTRELADIRDGMHKLRDSNIRLQKSMQDSEAVVVDTRMEVQRLEASQKEIEGLLDEAVVREANLEEDMREQRIQMEEANRKLIEAREARDAEAAKRREIMAQFDKLRQQIEDLQSELSSTIVNYEQRLVDQQEKFEREFREFKEVELEKIKAEFSARADKIQRRNEILEREVAIADTVIPHLNALAPVGATDKTKICLMCRKAVMYEGPVDKLRAQIKFAKVLDLVPAADSEQPADK